MFFTQEDYRKIEKWLLANSRKDTDFVGAATPLKGNETVVLVQNGKNVRASVKDVVEQLFLLGVSDFVNITDKYNESYISLSQAIELIPYRSRKVGQVVTFLDDTGKWSMYQFQGLRKNQWNTLSLWVDLIDLMKGMTVVDSEDIVTEVNSANQTSLKFADKTYNEADFSGLGRVYLRKNIQTVVNPNTGITYSTNFLTQAMLSKENTIYIIQYDYNLNGQTITIPSGCVLLFEGGSISNGELVFNNTLLEGNINIDCSILGSVTNSVVHTDWFNLVGQSDATKRLNQILYVSPSTLYIDEGKYIITDSIIPKSNFTITGSKGLSILRFYCNRYSIANKISWIVKFTDQNNVTIENITLDGGEFTATEPVWDLSGAERCIYFQPIANNIIHHIYIRNCEILKSWDSGIGFYGRAGESMPHYSCDNIHIENCYIHDTGFHGVGLGNCQYSSVNNNNFYNIGTVPMVNNYGSGLAVSISEGCKNCNVIGNRIDIAGGAFKCETHIYDTGMVQSENIVLSNNIATNLRKGAAYGVYYGAYLNGHNCIMSNNYLQGAQGHGVLVGQYAENCVITDNIINDFNGCGIQLSGSNTKAIGNTIYDTYGPGIWLNGISNKAANNKVFNIHNAGVRLSSSHSCILEDNTIFNCDNVGIYINTTNKDDVTNTVIKGNSSYNTEGSIIQKYGITVGSSNQVTLAYNNCYNNAIKDYNYKETFNSVIPLKRREVTAYVDNTSTDGYLIGTNISVENGSIFTIRITYNPYSVDIPTNELLISGNLTVNGLYGVNSSKPKDFPEVRVVMIDHKVNVYIPYVNRFSTYYVELIDCGTEYYITQMDRVPAPTPDGDLSNNQAIVASRPSFGTPDIRPTYTNRQNDVGVTFKNWESDKYEIWNGTTWLNFDGTLTGKVKYI